LAGSVSRAAPPEPRPMLMDRMAAAKAVSEIATEQKVGEFHL
jgi:hypothetical protein